MAQLRIEILSGAAAGRVFESELGLVKIGRGEANDLALADAHVSTEHVWLVASVEGFIVEDRESSNGTWIVRGSERIFLDGAELSRPLCSGDVLEIGGPGDEGTRLRVEFAAPEEPAQVVALHPLGGLSDALPRAEAPERLRALLECIRRLGAEDSLDEVVGKVAEAALALVPRATHASIVLSDAAAPDGAAGLLPVATRVRGKSGAAEPPGGAVPVTRSVVRKVIRERAAVLVADAPNEAFSSESLLGASIRSTIGVPLWKGSEILGVLQVDNRDAPAMFDARDVDVLGLLAANASLAVKNARLIQKLGLAEQQLRKENQYLRGRGRARGGGLQIVGQSRAMSELIRQLDKVVGTRVTVLIEGETGAGKELIARAVHDRSNRRDKLFVAQNCAAFPENLLESELFGHKRGAFTGATEEKKGLFEIADGGTLFLDEVTEMPLALQSKLLRVLQEGEIRPVGGTQTRHVNVRIVAATNRNLETEVAEGRFREDLYYRLKVFPIRVPALRERRDDIPLLARHFLERYSLEMGRPVAGFAPETLELLCGYDFPGNVRELENEIQRVVIQADPGALLTPELLSPRVRQIEGIILQAGAAKGSLRAMVDQVEKHILIEALREHGNNKTSAAKALGITREGLHKKLKQLGIG